MENRTIFEVLGRQWRAMLTLWISIMLLVVAATAISTPYYQSEGKLFLRLGRENATLDPTAAIGSGGFVAPPPTREHEINSIVDILGSREVMAEVVDAVGIEQVLDQPVAQTVAVPASTATGGEATLDEVINRLLPFETDPREKAIKKFYKRFSVAAVKKSNVITLTYEATSPEAAQKTLQAVIDAYLARHGRLNRTPGSHEFLERQAGDLKVRLMSTEQELRDLKNASNVTSIDEQRRLLEARLSGLQDHLYQVGADLEGEEARIAELEATLKVIPAALVTAKVEGHANEGSDGMRQQLYSLELREQVLLSKFTPEHIEVKQTREQIKEARRIFDSFDRDRTQTTVGPDTTHQQLKLALLTAKTSQSGLVAQAAALAKQVDAAEEAIDHINDRALRIAQLEREVSLQDNNYRRYTDNLEQTRLDQALESEHISNVAVAEAPTLERRIVRPKKLINFALGFVLATAASLALAVRREWSHIVDQPEETNGLQYPVTASADGVRETTGTVKRRTGLSAPPNAC